MSEVRHQLLITLVHGTWPGGFFPRLVPVKKWVRELRGQSSEPLVRGRQFFFDPPHHRIRRHFTQNHAATLDR